MKKRGVHSKAHKVSLSRKKTEKTKVSKERREKPGPKKTVLGISEPTAIREEQKIQRRIDEELKYLLSPQEIPIVLLICSLIILAFMLNSMSLIFYTAATLFVLWLAHFFHKHKHRPHDFVSILAIFFLPLTAALIMYRDLLMWFLLFVYLLSGLSTLLIYHYHGRKHRPIEIMWQTTYSKIVALTAGAIMISLLPMVLPASFVSITELILVYIFPIVLVVFFISKFLYIYYFEHKHIKNDIWTSIRYSVIYALLFAIIISACYALFAVQLNNADSSQSQKETDLALIDSTNIDKVFEQMPEETRNIQVTQEVIAFNSQLTEEIAAKKNEIMERELSFGDIIDDTYLEWMAENNYDIARFNTLLGSILDTKEQITGRYKILDETQKRNASMPDGSKEIASYAQKISKDVEDTYTPFYLDPLMAKTITSIEDPTTTYEYFEDNGINWFFADRKGIDPIYHSDSMLGRQVMAILRHTIPFRYLSALNMKQFMFERKEIYSGYIQQMLFEDRDNPETEMSKALRNEILLEKVKGRPQMITLRQTDEKPTEVEA